MVFVIFFLSHFSFNCFPKDEIQIFLVVRYTIYVYSVQKRERKHICGTLFCDFLPSMWNTIQSQYCQTCLLHDRLLYGRSERVLILTTEFVAKVTKQFVY
jgi:hypothetical protein